MNIRRVRWRERVEQAEDEIAFSGEQSCFDEPQYQSEITMLTRFYDVIMEPYSDGLSKFPNVLDTSQV